VNFTKEDLRKHMSLSLLSYFTKATSQSQLALDIGCGSRVVHKPLIEKSGYTYVGLDYSRPGATLFGDAHALPFEDHSFSFAISIAVLEHLAHPILALQEIGRVLAPGSRFVGSVAFLEPFHSNSFYHHTHRGLANGLLQSGFEILQMGYNPYWTAPSSLRKKLFPKIPSILSRPLTWPLYALSSLFWKVGALRSHNPALLNIFKRDLAGSFFFCCKTKS
jgi:SAM-dependent methyltransferase